MEYLDKYIKYKTKYITLKNQINMHGGSREEKTYIDFITKSSNKTIRINTTNENDIVNLFKKHFNNVNTLICLDFHGVTDLYDDNEKIPSDLSKCVISYIGGNPTTVLNTTNTIKQRLLSGDIILGIIVYNKNDMPSCGTKGWIISKIINTHENIKIHFIDDSKKNIQCIENVKSNNVKTYYINKNKNPKEHLTKILNRIN
jgi:hypothetical protein